MSVLLISCLYSRLILWHCAALECHCYAIIILLTHWGRVTHICVGNLTIIGSDNGLSPGRCQAIIWTNVGILLIGPLGTNFSEIVIGIHKFSFMKMHLKMSSTKWRPLSLGLHVLTTLKQSGLTSILPLSVLRRRSMSQLGGLKFGHKAIHLRLVASLYTLPVWIHYFCSKRVMLLKYLCGFTCRHVLHT